MTNKNSRRQRRHRSGWALFSSIRLLPSPFFAIWIALGAPTLSHCEVADNNADTLSVQDAEGLDRLFSVGLFDPVQAKARRVRGPAAIRTCYGKRKEVEEASGWLIPGLEGQPARLLLDNLQETVPPEDPRPSDLDGEALDVLASGGKEPAFALTGPGLFRSLDLQSIVWAAWLHRMGNDRTAARLVRKALADAGDWEEIRKRFKSRLAWSEFDQAVNAYIVRDDDEACRHAKRLLALENGYLREARGLLEELNRRKAAGTFGRRPPPLPGDFAEWPVDRRVAHLIDHLDEADALSPPGLSNPEGDPRFLALVACGEAAVPALLDCIEKDPRWTRWIGFWRDYAPARAFTTVRGAAFLAVRGILGTEYFDLRQDRETLIRLDTPEGVRETVALLRRYWAAYGGMPFPDRMMAILKDEQASPLAWREAAVNLAHVGQRRDCEMNRWLAMESRPSDIAKALEPFRNPTAAEAVLAALDRHVAALAAGRAPHPWYTRDRIENDYLDVLARFADRRIIPELKRRCDGAETPALRRKWAFCLHRLRESGPLDEFAKEFAQGRIRLPANDQPDIAGNRGGFNQPGNIELEQIIGALTRAGTEDCIRALDALAVRDHPYHAMAEERLRYCNPYSEKVWFSHPFCLKVLRPGLDDRHPDRTTWSLVEGRVLCQSLNAKSYGDLPAFLLDKAVRKEQAEGRWCDGVAMKLSRLVFGLPEYHPLLKEADRRLEEIRTFMDRYANRFRAMTFDESCSLHMESEEIPYIPDIQPLKAKASAEDVAAGRAIFHVEGFSTPAPLKLPAVAQQKPFTPGADSFRPPACWVLIVQAESLSDGKTRYGIVEPHRIQSVDAETLGPPTPVEEAQRK